MWTLRDLRDLLEGRRRLPVRGLHVHWCEACDRRWNCRVDPCLLFDAAPCPDRAHQPPSGT